MGLDVDQPDARGRDREVVDVRAAGGPAAVVEDLDAVVAAVGEHLADLLLARGPQSPGELVGRLLAERQQQPAELRVLLADVALALGLAALVLAAGALTGYAWVVGGLIFPQFEVHPRFTHPL